MTVNNADLVVDRRQVSVVGTVVADKSFDGQVSAVISQLGALQGLVDGENLVLSGQAEFVEPQPGVAKPVTVSYAIADGINGLTSNYQLNPNQVVLKAAIVAPARSIVHANLVPARVAGPRVLVASAGSSGGATGTTGATDSKKLMCMPSDVDSCACTKDSSALPEVCVQSR